MTFVNILLDVFSIILVLAFSAILIFGATVCCVYMYKYILEWKQEIKSLKEDEDNNENA